MGETTNRRARVRELFYGRMKMFSSTIVKIMSTFCIKITKTRRSQHQNATSVTVFNISLFDVIDSLRPVHLPGTACFDGMGDPVIIAGVGSQ